MAEIQHRLKILFLNPAILKHLTLKDDFNKQHLYLKKTEQLLTPTLINYFKNLKQN